MRLKRLQITVGNSYNNFPVYFNLRSLKIVTNDSNFQEKESLLGTAKEQSNDRTTATLKNDLVVTAKSNAMKAEKPFIISRSRLSNSEHHSNIVTKFVYVYK